MKTFLIVLAIVVALVIAGWLSFGHAGGEPAVILETNQIQHDTERATEKGKELLHEAEQKVEDLRKDRDTNDNADSRSATSPGEREPDDIQRATPPAEPR